MTDSNCPARRRTDRTTALWAGGFAALFLCLAGCGERPVGPNPDGASPAPATSNGSPSAPPAAASPDQGASADPSTPAEVDGPPPIRLDPPVLDFGILPPSASREGVVKLVNTGTRELEILTVQPSCKCTTLEDLAGKKIPPGGYVELRATMKAQSAPGKKAAEVKVLIDGFSQVIPVQLKQEVSLPIRVSPSYLNVVSGNPQTGRTVIESIDKQPFRICAIGGKRPNLVGFDPDKDEPRNQYILDWDFNRDFQPGEAKRYWLIETDREDCPLVDIFVRHESTVLLPRGVVATEYRHTFGRLEQGATYDFVLELTKLEPDERIVAAASSSSLAKVDLVSSQLEGDVMRVSLRVVPNADTIGLAWVPFSVYTSAGRQADQAVWGQYVPKGHTGCFGR